MEFTVESARNLGLTVYLGAFLKDMAAKHSKSQNLPIFAAAKVTHVSIFCDLFVDITP